MALCILNQLMVFWTRPHMWPCLFCTVGTGCPQWPTTETLQEMARGQNLEIGKIGKSGPTAQIRAPRGLRGVRRGPYQRYDTFWTGSTRSLAMAAP